MADLGLSTARATRVISPQNQKKQASLKKPVQTLRCLIVSRHFQFNKFF
jgi:hypothetical protein